MSNPEEVGLNASRQQVQEMLLSSSWRYNLRPEEDDDVDDPPYEKELAGRDSSEFKNYKSTHITNNSPTPKTLILERQSTPSNLWE